MEDVCHAPGVAHHVLDVVYGVAGVEERRISLHNMFSSLCSDSRLCLLHHRLDIWAERFSPILFLREEQLISDRDASMSSVPLFICACLH